MRKNSKKPMSPDKQRNKYGRILVIEAAADYIYTFRNNFEAILYRENMDSYITDDWKTNAELLMSIYLKRSDAEQKAQDIIFELFHMLIDVPFMMGREQLWTKIVELAKQFKKSYKVSQYFSIVRQFLIRNRFSHSFYPVWMVLDYEYCQDGIIAGETDTNIIIQRTQMLINGEPLELPYCYAATIDNVSSNKPECYDTYKVMKRYAETKSKRFVSAYAEEDGAGYLPAIAHFCSLTSMSNKFMFDNPTIMFPKDLEKYTQLIQCAKSSRTEREVDAAMKNFFMEIPIDIFNKRKYIIVDSNFPSLSFDLYEVLDDSEIKKASIENVRVYEKSIKKQEQEYYMIFMEYTILDVKRTISVCIDNILATAEAFNIIDKFAFLILLGVYGLNEEFASIQLKDENLTEIFEDIKNIVSGFEFVPSEHTVSTGIRKHRQTKEVYVEAFVRRLPKGQTASEEAKALAKKYRVDLGNDRTIVSPYIRNKGREKNE